MFDRTKYLIMLKSNISDVYSHIYTKIKINSDDDLPLENMQNVELFINHYLIKMFV